MSRGRCRPGATLAELSVALLIGGVAAAAGASLLLAAERRTRRDASRDLAAQTARDAAHVLRADIASGRLGSLAPLADTAIDLDAHIGASVVCAASGRVLVLPGPRTSLSPAFTFLRAAPEPEDILLAWDTAGNGWRETVIDSVVFRADGAGCPASGFLRSAADSVAREPVIRMHVAAALPGTVGPGAPVRILRGGRWLLYRGTDRHWWLGYRRCPRGNCGGVQPVAGPLARPADSGLVLGRTADGSIGMVITPLDAPALARAGRRRTLAARGAVGGTP